MERDFVPKEHQNTHDDLMVMRHRAMAHLDAVGFKPDEPGFGNMNQVSIRKARGEFTVSVIFPGDGVLKHAETKQLCSRLIEKTEYHIDRFCKNHIRNKALPCGDYLVNIEETDKRPFLPTLKRPSG